MSYRNDVDALAARHAAVAAQAAEIAKERDEAQRLVDDARAKARLPVLENIRVASPCSESWAAMSGDERVRACGKCQQQVFNLSAMTREDAEALIAERVGRLCVRYYQRADGTILLADCTVGRRGRRMRKIAAVGVAAGLAGGLATYAAMREGANARHAMMGEIAMDPSPDTTYAVQGGVSFAEPVTVTPQQVVSDVREVKGKMVIAPPQLPQVKPPGHARTATKR